MFLLGLLKKYIPRMLRRMNRPFKVPAKKQEAYLKSLPDPKDRFDCAFYQYKCQKIFWGIPFFIAASCLAAVLLPIQWLKLQKLVRDSSLQDTGNANEGKIKLVMVADEMPKGIFPDELTCNYKISKVVGALDGLYFDEFDITFFKQLWRRYSLSPYFLYKCLMKQAGYSYIIHTYTPDVITSCGGECTYTSSFLTEYCNARSIRHFNVMHGEMMYYILDAFCSFNRFYVWDDYYRKLLFELRAVSDEFEIALPQTVKIDLSDINTEGRQPTDYKYYLQLQQGEELRNIADSLNKLKGKGYSVAVRYHPRTTNLEEIERLFAGMEIENPREVDIRTSIKLTNKVVALNSTVLFQTYVSGGTPVIDDVSNVKLYSKLKEIRYILIEKGCVLLSESM